MSRAFRQSMLASFIENRLSRRVFFARFIVLGYTLARFQKR